MFSSCPVAAFVAGVKIGSARRSDSIKPGGSVSPATVPSALYSVHADPEMYPRATHSMSMRSHRFTSTVRCASSFRSRNAGGKRRMSVETRWFGTMCAVLRNQKFESCVRMRPLSGIGVGMTTSNADSRSLATMTSRSPPASYTSRTLPRRKSVAPGMSGWTTVLISSRSPPPASRRRVAARSAAGGLAPRGRAARRSTLSFGQHTFQPFSPGRRDVARHLGREPAVFLRLVEDAPLLGRELLQVLAHVAIEHRDLEHGAAGALGLEGQLAHGLVRVGVSVLGEEDVERLGRDRAAGRCEVALQPVA